MYEAEGGGHNGYCWACGEWVSNPYGDNEEHLEGRTAKDPALVEYILDEISECEGGPLPLRDLTEESLDHFGVTIGLSREDGVTPEVRHLPYRKRGTVTGYKVKMNLEKRQWSVGDMKGVDPFGWQEALSTGARTLFITEGEEDAVALYQALKEKQAGTQWSHLEPAVISLPHGSSSAKRMATDFQQEFKANFKDIVLVFDMDEAGETAAHDFLGVIPDARTVTLPAKDANACVMEGRSLALANAALFKAATPKNTRIVQGETLRESGKKRPEMGLSWPWEWMTKATRGIRYGETYYLGAGVKMGKSEVVNTLAEHLIVKHDLKVFLAKPEEANDKTIKMMLGKYEGNFFHDPDREFDDEAYDRAADAILPNLFLLNLYQHLGWESLRQDIISAASLGCKAVFIDPITNLTNGVSSGDANTRLQGIAQELAAMALDLQIVIFIFCHLKAPDAGHPHERGGKVLSHQFAGSRAMMRSCNYMLALEGDKDPDKTEDDRNMRKLVILEDREFGTSGYTHLFWDRADGIFKETGGEED